MIKYNVVGGQLPASVYLDEATGNISGDISFDNVDEGPVWVSPNSGEIGDFEVFDEIEPINLVINERNSVAIESISIMTENGSSLPWGLYLDPYTGVISGTVSQLKLFSLSKAENLDPPIWVTPTGSLADVDSAATFDDLFVLATPQKSKTLIYEVRGPMPWGLYLDQTTGEITGTLAELKTKPLGLEVPKTPLPTWVTPNGMLTDVREGDAVTSKVEATVAEGRTLVNYIITKGFIAPGLYLDQFTGNITGNAAEIHMMNQSEYVEPGKNPTISNTVKVNNVDKVITDGNLGTFTKGTAVSFAFTPVVVQERTLQSITFSPGLMPWGLYMDRNSGVLSGTIPANTSSGTYNFSLKVTDSADVSVVTTFTLTIQ